MTSNAGAGNRILGSLRSADGKGIVRMEDRFDTDIDDLWSALTDPSRLARWIGDVHLPDVGYVAIPIALTVGETHADTRSIDLQFTSANNAASFPRFTGAAGIDTTGPTGSILWLAGDYDVPLHVAGRLFDKTLASGVAERALGNLADDWAVALIANVEKREAEYVRYRMFER